MLHCLLNDDYPTGDSDNATVKRTNAYSTLFREQRVKPGGIIGRKFFAEIAYDTFGV